MDTPLVRRAYNLGLKATANFADVLSEQQIGYYEQHLDELPLAISRGFVLPGQIVTCVETPVSASVTVEVQDLDWWLVRTQEFTAKQFGVTVDLRNMFAIPTELPWKSAIPVFDPGHLTNRMMVEQALKGCKFKVYEGVDVMKYSGSEALGKPTLHFIENSPTPNKDTMGKSPDDLRATEKLYLRLRGYGLAFGVYNFATGKLLDPKETLTWFPEDRLPDGEVARGYWSPGRRGVRFGWGRSGYRGSDIGGRVAIPVPLKT